MPEPNITEADLKAALDSVERGSACHMCDLNQARESQLRRHIDRLENRIIFMGIAAEDQAQAAQECAARQARRISWLYLSLVALAGFCAFLVCR